jgi:hypothetical protein
MKGNSHVIIEGKSKVKLSRYRHAGAKGEKKNIAPTYS